MKNKNKTPPANNYDGEPLDSFGLVNKYGTYEIQPTCGMQSDYPKIAQGVTPKIRKQSINNPKNKDR